MRIILTILCAVLFISAHAQNRKLNNTTQLWSEVDFAGKTKHKLKWQLDLQYSRQSPYEDVDFYKYTSQVTVRPWLHYFITPRIKLSAFAGLWYNYYIQEVGARQYPEYRIALQATVYTPLGASLLSNRFRCEYRDIMDKTQTFEPVARGRYMLKYLVPFAHTLSDKHTVYGIAFDEIFVNGGSPVTGVHLFDQNRLFLGVGYNITSNISVETGYFNQLQQHAHDANEDVNHIWQVSLIVDNIDLTKHKHA